MGKETLLGNTLVENTLFEEIIGQMEKEEDAKFGRIGATNAFNRIKGSLEFTTKGFEPDGTPIVAIKGVKNWRIVAEEMTETLNLFIYGVNGVFVFKDNVGKYRLMGESPIDVVRKQVTLVFDLSGFSIDPQLTGKIATAVMDRVKVINPVLDDNDIYFNNGTYNTKTGVFTAETNPSYNHRRIDWPYLDHAERNNATYKPSYEKLAKFLDTISEKDKDIQMQIMQMIGASLLPTKQFRKAFFMLGQGGNGKSSLLNMLNKVHGQEKIASIALENMTGQRAPFVCYGLVNKTVNIIDDLSNVSMKENGVLKTIISGGQLSAEVKGGKMFNFMNEASLVAAGNAMPNFNDKGDSTAIIDRLVIIPLNHKFDKTPQGVAEAARLEQDDAITVLASVCAEATYFAQKNGLVIGTKSKAKSHEFEIETDSVAYWLANNDFFDDSLAQMGRVKCDNAYEDYKQFTIKSGGKPFGLQIFGKAIMKNRPTIFKDRIRDGVNRIYVYKDSAVKAEEKEFDFF